MREEDFIKSLSEELEPRPSLASSQHALVLWMIFSFVILVLGVFLHSIRRDIGLMLASSSYYAELLFGLILGGVTAANALQMRIPGMKPAWKFIASLLGIWIVSSLLHSVLSTKTDPFTFKATVMCFVSLLALAFLPGAFLYFQVKRGFTTSPREALALVGIAMSGMAGAFLPLACGNDGAVHLLLGHILPVFALGFAAWRIGPSLLRW